MGFENEVPEEVEIDEHGVIYAEYADGAADEFDHMQVFIAHQAKITHTEAEDPGDQLVVLKFANQNAGDMPYAVGIPWNMMTGFVKLLYDGWMMFLAEHAEVGDDQMVVYEAEIVDEAEEE